MRTWNVMCVGECALNEKPVDRFIVILYVTYAYAELSICICCSCNGRSGQRRQMRLVCQFGRNG
jgi:hypothetical protein